MKCIPCSVPSMHRPYLLKVKCLFHASKSLTVPNFGMEHIRFRFRWILIDVCFHDFVRLMIVVLCKNRD